MNILSYRQHVYSTSSITKRLASLTPLALDTKFISNTGKRTEMDIQGKKNECQSVPGKVLIYNKSDFHKFIIFSVH